MAIAAGAVWEARSGASASNVGGGFWVPGSSGTDYSQQNAPQYSLTGGTSSGAGAVLLHASAAADMVGNGLHIISGTNATAGWYQVMSVVVGVSITVDRNDVTGVAASVVFNVGGAVSLQHSTDQSLFNTMQAGNKMWILNGTYTLTGTLNVNVAAGSNTAYIALEGYAVTRGDQPRGSTRPTIKGGVTIWNNDFSFTSIIFSHNGAGDLFTPSGTRCFALYCKFFNWTTTANQRAVLATNYNSYLFCEFISYRGIGLQGANAINVYGCYFHDSDIGLKNSNGSGNYPAVYDSCIFEGCVTAAIQHSAAMDVPTHVMNCTIYGAENKLGIGLSVATAGAAIRAFGNIFYGFTTGINIADASGSGQASSFLFDYNDFFNNTADVTNATKGPNCSTLTPSFTSVTQTKGTNGTTSGSVLTSSGATFPAFTAGVDFLYLVSGTGITAGVYGIVSNTSTTITLDIAPGTNATNDKVFQVTSGHNLAVGSNMQGIGPLGAFTGGLSMGYQDIGAVQRKERASTDPGISNVKTGVGYTINDSALTGTYTAAGGGSFTSVL